MTVQELCNRLEFMPRNATVLMEGEDEDHYYDIRSVRGSKLPKHPEEEFVILYS